MSVRNLKDGHKKPWLCECYPQGRNGKRIRQRFATKGEATAFERYTMNEVDDKPWLGDKPDTRKLSDLIELWWQLHAKNLKSGAHAHRRMVIICEHLDDPIATSITAKDYAHYRANRRMVGASQRNGIEELSAASQNYDLKCMRAMFNELIRLKEWNYPNPLTSINLIPKSEPELNYLSQQQIITLLSFVQGQHHAKQLTQIIKICLATGARVSEAMNLKGSQLSKYKITFSNTKSRKNRTVPISEALYNEIYQDKNDKLFTCNYVAIWKGVSHCFTDLPKGQATHILRHTFASYFMMNGGNILVLQKILGHADISQTMRYSHFSPSHLQDAVSFNPLVNLVL
ncbi:Integrase [Moritella viscosa]|uniref:phage integrase n=1 Tax=Moritella viscosa TaxID=80854 RepID=UPI00090FB6A6|nr:tyrosine-type recombinase/integrase [Moritella viscosa]SGZ03434.1 Integrase [Moritella viscosa]